jgi:hypothetical protein
MRRGQDNAPRFRSGSASESRVQRLGARIVFVALESVAIESPERIGLANGGWGTRVWGAQTRPGSPLSGKRITPGFANTERDRGETERDGRPSDSPISGRKTGREGLSSVPGP